MAEFGSFVTLGLNPQHAEYLEHKLAQFPKGTKALSRQLVTWDVIRVETAAVDNIELDSWTSRGIDKQGMTGTDAVSCADWASLLTQLPLFIGLFWRDIQET